MRQRRTLSSANLAEVVAVLTMRSIPQDVIDATIRDFGLKIVPLDETAATLAGRLIPAARPLGIGLGDCAYIATGIVRSMTIWTADPGWVKLDAPGADIKLIRNSA